MSDLVFVLLIVYAIGIFLVVLSGLDYRHQHEPGDPERQWGARLALKAPLWPFMGLRLLGQYIGGLLLDATRKVDD